ncbi:sigma-E factor negative regulatory protein [Ralstonia pseudosolanacearum]|uniref:sigma-E factor negative regulatory protein n=1 Tax=Ralstonia pseudosolanacearum TaxID=1310165 RepID=UPI0008D959C3|nr:sigma-E factor negative regulatory protein [Ralstonia pseudosolanacearum]MCL1620080.1 sigma-E factor negative regulatory protein [Ralstonia pseudosolanacearum CaRs-Mep]MCQ4680366.1 sigma-E factor negative regulatory protein [Ralstonia pseudosolanacearum]
MGQAQMQAADAGFAERISALMDGEVAAHEAAAAVELAKDGEGVAHWREYQLIGDALRSEDLLGAHSTEAFLGRFSAKLDAEPHLLVPAVVQRAQTEERHRFLVRPSWVRRVMPSTAVAAAVAAVSWVVVPQLRGPTGSGDASPALVAKAQQGAGAQAVTVSAAENTPMIRDARLDEYLSAHRQSATNGVVVPYLRAVANGAASTQDSSQE